MGKILENLNMTIVAGLVLSVILFLILHLGAVDTGVFWSMIFRWVHVFFGILWIGLLYYFNFVQIPNMGKIPDEQKPAIGKVIAPAALFYFRWAAALTLLFGLVIAIQDGYIVEALTFQSPATVIGIGMWLGIIMAFNVWFVIWPNQKKALGIVEADADAKKKAARTAMLFSRTNTLLSFPMLYCMIGQGQLPMSRRFSTGGIARTGSGDGPRSFFVGGPPLLDSDQGRGDAATFRHQHVVSSAGSPGIHRFDADTRRAEVSPQGRQNRNQALPAAKQQQFHPTRPACGDDRFQALARDLVDPGDGPALAVLGKHQHGSTISDAANAEPAITIAFDDEMALGNERRDVHLGASSDGSVGSSASPGPPSGDRRSPVRDGRRRRAFSRLRVPPFAPRRRVSSYRAASGLRQRWSNRCRQ
jgi:hypothetical protein